MLPATATTKALLVAGYKVNGPLFEGSTLTILHKGVRPYLLKKLDNFELARTKALLLAVTEVSHPNVTSFQVYEETGSTYVIMPKYSTTLEMISSIDTTDVGKMWSDLKDALEYLHGFQFAFMDTKPSNICIQDGNFILIDLGSVCVFQKKSSCTLAYIPRDLRPKSGDVVASALLDWWMLLMTIGEKVGADVSPDGGPRNYTRENLLQYLKGSVSGDLFGDMIGVLRGDEIATGFVTKK